MQLPAGFDPTRMTFGRNIVSEIPRHTYTPHYTNIDYEESIWSRFNNWISSIGNWLDDNLENIIAWLFIALYAFLIIGLAVWIFHAESIFWGICRGIGACIIFGIAYYVIMAISFVSAILIKLLRFCFWNAYTFLLTVTVVVAFWGYRFISEHDVFSSNYEDVATHIKSNGEFVISDIAIYNLTGHVKSFHEKNNGRWVEIATFTSKGTLESLYGKDIENVKKIVRDNDGHIISMTDVESNDMDGGHDSETYKWSDGRLVSSTWDSPAGQTTTSYIYNDEGRLVGTHTTGFQGDDVDTTEDYTDIEYDDHGNWTSRTRKYKDGSITREFKDERTIIYWD